MYLLGEKAATAYLDEKASTAHPEEKTLTTQLDGHTFVIGSGIGRPLREYIEIMRDAIDPSLPLGIGEVPYGPKQVMHLQADISDLTAATGFTPEVDFAEGIRRTIEYVKSL